MPQPEEGFGWGVELEWYDLLRDGVTLGFVDSTPMWHLKKPGASYAAELELKRQEALFAERGLSGWADVQHIRSTIRFPWSQSAPSN